MNSRFNDPLKGLSGIVHCLMIDNGCRLKDNYVNNISKTLYSLGYFMQTSSVNLNGN